MVELRPWIDLTPTRQGASTASQLTQSDRMVTGTVSEILDDGTVAVSIDGSTDPDVVVPSASGITAVGATVRVSRDSSGRAVEASIPESIPPGASTAPVGVTGDWLMGLDALTATLDGAQGELSDAQAALKAHLAELGIDTDSVTVTDELWARLAVFAQVTTDMLIAGNATITNEMIVNTLVGKILQGGLLLAGGGDLPQVLVGPLSGQVGTGDQYGISITTPNGNANGSAVLGVAPTGPFLEFYDGTGALVLAADKAGVRVVNQTDGGMVDLSKITTQRWTWTRTGTRTVLYNNTNGTNSGTWAFFTDANNTNGIGTILTVSSPSGRLRVDGGVRIAQSSGTYGNESLAVQWGVYSSDPANNDRTDVTTGLVKGAAECYYQNTATPFFGIGTSIVDVTPNKNYYIRPFYRQGVMGPSVTRNVGDMWVSVTPA